MDRGGRDVTRRGVSRERADLERAGVSRGVSARAEGVRTRRATLARLASARAPRERANPNDSRRMHMYLRPMVSSHSHEKKTTVRSVARTYLRSRCPPAEPSKRRASRCPASRTEPVPRKGGSGEIKTSDGQLEVLRRPRTRVGNETIGNTVCLAENRDATPSVSSGRCRAPRRRRDRGESSMGSFDVP